MVRWKPGAPERLQEAALELFATRGYEQTTAAEIAQAVGLTERTFFRHFADKREVLFSGQHLLAEAFLAGVAAAPAEAAPMEIVAEALRSAATYFPDERRPYARLRQTVIDRNPPLQERELHKLATLATALADALRARGVDDPAATLAARSAITVFEVAFARWIREERSLADVAAELLGELQVLVTPRRASPGSELSR